MFDVPIVIKEESDTETQIKWLDVKNYFLADIPFLLDKLRDQAKKYNDAFGNGAFVFHLGLDPKIKIDNTLILDGSFVKFYLEPNDTDELQSKV